jgi:hypothetical protein
MVVNIDQLAPEEPLSPELVLVLPPELRATALQRLPSPVWSKPPPPARAPAAAAEDWLARDLAAVLLPRLTQLVLIFVAVTALTLLLSAVADAIR